MRKEAEMNQRAAVCILALAVMRAGVAPAAIAQGLPVRDSGQTTTPVYEGWYQNADGTLTLSWGYFNRNAKEILDIPLDHVTGCPRPAARVNVVRSPYAR